MAKDELRNLVKSILGCSDIVVLSNQERQGCLDQSLDELSWLDGLRCCPQGILDLINSKACRGQSDPPTINGELTQLLHRRNHVQRWSYFGTMQEARIPAITNGISLSVCPWKVRFMITEFFALVRFDILGLPWSLLRTSTSCALGGGR